MRALPAELGRGASALLRSLQPRECNTLLLPWQSRHCQTGRMCERGGGQRGCGSRDWWRGSVDMSLCVCVCVMDAWEMAAESVIHWPPCLVVRRLNTRRHTFKHTNTHRAVSYQLRGSPAKSCISLPLYQHVVVYRSAGLGAQDRVGGNLYQRVSQPFTSVWPCAQLKHR